MTPLYAPQGRWWLDTVDGLLPLPEWVSYRVQVPHSGVGGFDLTLPRQGLNVERLLADMQTALVYEVMAANGSWQEPPNCRFLPLKRTYNSKDSTVSVSGAGLGWLLGRIVRGPYAYDNDDHMVEFTARSAGYILSWFFNAQKVRRGVLGISPGFDLFHDSNGEDWPETYNIDYDRGLTLRQVMDGFESDGLLWRMNGTSWEVVADAFGDTPADVPTLYDGIDVQADQVSVDLSEYAGTVLATGKDGYYAWSQTDTAGRWGRWEVAQSHGQATGAAVDRLAVAERSRRGVRRESSTVTLLPSARFRPFDTIVPGQSIVVQYESPSTIAGRWNQSNWNETYWGGPGRWWESQGGPVNEIVVTDDGTASTVSLSIGAREASPDDLLRQAVTSLTGGVVVRGTLGGKA